MRREHLLNMAELMQNGADKEIEILRVSSMNQIDELQDKLVVKQNLTKEETAFNAQILQLMEDKTLEQEQKVFEIKKKWSEKWIEEAKKQKEAEEAAKKPDAKKKPGEDKNAKQPEDNSMSGLISQLGTLNTATEAGKERYIDMLNELKDKTNSIGIEIGNSMGNIVAGAITGNEQMVKDGAKRMLLFTIETIKREVQAVIIAAETKAIAQSLSSGQSIATFGIAGIAQAAATVALIEAAFQTFSSAIETGFAQGGYTPSGGKYHPAGIVHSGEYVAPQEALQNETVRPYIDVIEQARQNGGLRQLNMNEAVKAMNWRHSYATGGLVQPSQQQTTTITQTTDSGLAATLAALNASIESLKKEGVKGVWEWDKYKKDLAKMDRIEKRVKG